MKEKTVLVTGCFDVLHRGHIELLYIAAEHGKVVVGINDDESVQKLKGPKRPVNNEVDRLFLIEALGSVTYGFIVFDVKVDKAIMDIKPDIWMKGGDYTMETLNKDEVEAARNVGAEIIIIPTCKGYSTTETLKKLEAE